MANVVETLAVEWVAEMSQWREELAKMPRETDEQLKTLVALTEKRLGAVERSFKKAGSSAGGAKKDISAFEKSMTAASNAADSVGRRVQKLSGFLDVLAPGLGNVAQLGADVGDVLEIGSEGLSTFGASAGVVALGLGGLGAAYAVVTREIALATAENETYRESNARLEPILRSIEDAQLDLSVALGYTTEAEARQEQARLAAQRGVKDYAAGLRDQRAELRANIDEAQGWLDLVNTIIPAQVNLGGMAADAVFGWSDSIESANRQLGALDQEEQAAAAGLKRHRDEAQNLAAATDAKREADERARGAAERRRKEEERLAAALREQEAALRAALAASEEDSQLNDQALAGIEKLQAAATSASASQLDGEAKVRAALDGRLSALEEDYQATLRAAGGDAQRLAASEAYEAARVETIRAAEAEITKIRGDAAQQQAEAYEQAAKVQLDVIGQVGDYVEQGVGMLADSFESSYEAAADVVSRLEAQLAASEEYLTEAQQKNLKRRIEAARDAAEAQFEAGKNAKAAEAMAATALAAINAIAQSPPPSPFGLAGAAIATGLGVAAVSQIESQQFTAYTGGMPDEVAATLHRNEAVLSQQGRSVLGDEVINAANAGVPMSAGPTDVRFVYGHREWDVSIAGTVRRGGLLRREFRTTTTTSAPSGHGSR